MCRNIKTLYNFAPPATDDEVRASAIQFVRKLSGFTNPSKANEAAFERAVAGAHAHSDVQIDLSGLDYVDASGIRLLYRLRRRGVGLRLASPLVAGLLAAARRARRGA